MLTTTDATFGVKESEVTVSDIAASLDRDDSILKGVSRMALVVDWSILPDVELCLSTSPGLEMVFLIVFAGCFGPVELVEVVVVPVELFDVPDDDLFVNLQ